jgi:carbon storage regulator
MLVLSRKIGERVLVGDKVVITVVRIGPNAVRLGIEAPKDVNIVREEIAAEPVPGVCVPAPLAAFLR